MPSPNTASGPSFRLTKLIISFVCTCCAIFVGWQFVTNGTRQVSDDARPANVAQLVEAKLVSQNELSQTNLAVERRKRLSDTTKRLLEWANRPSDQGLEQVTTNATAPAPETDQVSRSEEELAEVGAIELELSDGANENVSANTSGDEEAESEHHVSDSGTTNELASVSLDSSVSPDESLAEEVPAIEVATLAEPEPARSTEETPASIEVARLDEELSIPMADEVKTKEAPTAIAPVAPDNAIVGRPTEGEKAAELSDADVSTGDETGPQTAKKDDQPSGMRIAHRADGATEITLRIDGQIHTLPVAGEIKLKGAGPWKVQFMNGSVPASPVASLPAGNYSIGMSAGNFQMRRGI